MIGAPNTRGQKYWVGIVQWAPETSVSGEIADISSNYNIDFHYYYYLYYNHEKYPLSPLKPRGLALLSWHVRYNWGSGNSVHPSFTWFPHLNWRKSTFHRTRVPISFQNLTPDGLLWRHRHMCQRLAMVTVIYWDDLSDDISNNDKYTS